MSDQSVTELRHAGRRAPAVLLLFALVALIAGVCHGTHGHSLAAPAAAVAVPPAALTPVGGAVAPAAAAAFSAPGLPHGCERSGDGWSFDAHLPAQSAGAQFPAPDAGGAVLLAYDEVFPEAPHTRCVRGRAGPGPQPGRLLIALGVDRN
ncbi:hypothetical protein [Streptomyces showdoensis]|uniref:hypothetical protein n=1 Tax=Streptomyces showdoensis TaxID=68268 RepID=UPI00103F0354|nr:hypothetical protein [Streptomyces showdoensis]